jgi:hypothetical protein
MMTRCCCIGVCDLICRRKKYERNLTESLLTNLSSSLFGTSNSDRSALQGIGGLKLIGLGKEASISVLSNMICGSSKPAQLTSFSDVQDVETSVLVNETFRVGISFWVKDKPEISLDDFGILEESRKLFSTGGEPRRKLFF